MPLRVKPVNSPGTVSFNMPASTLVAVFAAPGLNPSVTVGIDCEDIGIVDFSADDPTFYQVAGGGSVVDGRIDVDLSDPTADVRLYFDVN